ncbi:MAG: helix-turn-helix domain-containing protein, partial [candidate division Zixibacteria bacterium]|nr:helix-turn-helix domain-containing protein [candidate division Zixibacteria bacterium]
MGQKYIQLNGQERFDIAHLRSNRISIRQIAAAVDRAPSTVAREIKRNCNRNGSYTPMYADQQSRARRWSGSMLDRDRELRQTVVIALLIGWSPQQIAGRLARDARGPMISHETIYRFIYAQITRTN